MEGLGHVLRRHKVINHLDTTVEVLDLEAGQTEAGREAGREGRPREAAREAGEGGRGGGRQ